MSLKIKGLYKRFGKKTIFDGFSYEFPETGIFVLRGNSGIGKTTLLRIIAGLDKDFSGEIVGGGIESVSFAFQEYRLFPELTAVDNVLIASKNATDDLKLAEDLLLSLDFKESELRLYPSELSGGMKQRVSLCRAFLKKSPILLLDEPTKELDRELCEAINKMIRDVSKERLVIMVTHNDDDARALGANEIKL